MNGQETYRCGLSLLYLNIHRVVQLAGHILADKTIAYRHRITRVRRVVARLETQLLGTEPNRDRITVVGVVSDGKAHLDIEN